MINWRKDGEVRPGKWTPGRLVRCPATTASALRALYLSVLTEVDRLHIAARGTHAMNDCLRARQGAIMLAEDDEGVHLVHGWPPCRSSRCLVILHRFAELIQAVALENTSRPGPRRR
jgi:hypothetical protein